MIQKKADKFIRILTEKFALLANHPLIGATRDDFRAGLRSLAYKSYVIFYMPTNYGIQVDRVLHGARDIPTIFLEESE